jgi:hypothetical protein
VQLVDGLGSPRVGFGVSRVRAPAVAYFGQYKFVGGMLVAVHHRGLGAAKKQKCRGLTVTVRDTEE